MKRILTVLTVATITTTVFAQTKPAGPQGKKLKYLTPDQIDPGKLLPPPPTDGSDLQKREMADVKHLIQTRTKERYARAKWDAAHENATAFESAIGAGFDLQKLPATAAFLDSVLSDQAIAASVAKDYFKRKFPVTAEMPANYGEWTCDTDDRKPESRPLRSYPSGHSTLAFSVGIVLANLMPEKGQAIMTRAADYAYSREVCGDHYHSDVDASRILGSAVGIMLLNSPALKPQMEAARAELKAAHLTSGN